MHRVYHGILYFQMSIRRKRPSCNDLPEINYQKHYVRTYYVHTYYTKFHPNQKFWDRRELETMLERDAKKWQVQNIRLLFSILNWRIQQCVGKYYIWFLNQFTCVEKNTDVNKQSLQCWQCITQSYFKLHIWNTYQLKDQLKSFKERS